MRLASFGPYPVARPLLGEVYLLQELLLMVLEFAHHVCNLRLGVCKIEAATVKMASPGKCCAEAGDPKI